MAIEKFYEVLPEPEKNVENLVILTHGYGADGQDLIALAQEWQSDFPNTAFIAPDAPQVCEQSPFGRQWYSLREWSLEAMYQGAESVRTMLTEFIVAQATRFNVTMDRVVLLGFSQGTMVSLHAGLRMQDAPKGILAFSGLLPGADKIAEEVISKPEICLVHGHLDDVVPANFSIEAQKYLQAAGVETSLTVIPHLSHGIDGDGLSIGRSFLQKCFQ